MTGRKAQPRAKASTNPPLTNDAAAEEGDLLASNEDTPLDPKTSTRRYWRDPHSGTQREIWRPGDGDGDIEHDHFERKGPAAPLDKRWRLYQLSPAPFKARITEPPSNVILDDRAVHEILQSNIPRAQLSKRWSHDFSGQANVRHRRSHRGRPAYKNEQATEESEKFHAFKASAKVPPYYFCGERDFQPVFYADLPPEAVAESEDSQADETPDSSKPKHHNQYTAPELLVRNGAQSLSQTKGKYRARVNTFLRRSPSPPWVKDRKKLFGGVGIGRGPVGGGGAEGSLASAGFGFSFASAPAPAPAPAGEQGGSMWVAQDEGDEMDGEDEDMVLPSIFDQLGGGNSARETDDDENGGESRSRRPENPLKRPTPSSFFFSRPKAPKEMGYIERLAAGLLQEDIEAVAESGDQPGGLAAGEVRSVDMVSSERVEELERQLEDAREIIGEREEEIRELKELVEAFRRRDARIE